MINIQYWPLFPITYIVLIEPSHPLLRAHFETKKQTIAWKEDMEY